MTIEQLGKSYVVVFVRLTPKERSRRNRATMYRWAIEPVLILL